MDSEQRQPDSASRPKDDRREREPCAVCGRDFEVSLLVWQQGEGWLCGYCLLESGSCGCEDAAE